MNERHYPFKTPERTPVVKAAINTFRSYAGPGAEMPGSIEVVHVFNAIHKMVTLNPSISTEGIISQLKSDSEFSDMLVVKMLTTKRMIQMMHDFKVLIHLNIDTPMDEN